MSAPPSAEACLGRSPAADDLLESANYGIYGVDLEGRCRFVNAAAARMLGYAPSELLGRNMHDVVHHSRADGTRYPAQHCPVFEAYQAGASCRVEDEVLWRKDGRAVYVEYAASPLVENGHITGALVTFLDIGARRRAHDQLRRARDELEQRVAARTRQLHEAMEELNHTTERLRELSAHISRACEDDRSRIAREIHDELGSVLVALKLDLSWLGARLGDRPELCSKTVAMQRLLNNAVIEVGRIITDLRPSILDHQGLWAAMEWHAQEVLSSSGLRGHLCLGAVAALPPPDGPLGTAVYRIFQEMLNNVVRHAHASAVEIDVACEDGGLTIDVQDNGRGITTEELDNPRSYGLIGMYERARHFGGRVSVCRVAEGGTRVRAWLPYQPPAASRIEANQLETNDDPSIDL